MNNHKMYRVSRAKSLVFIALLAVFCVWIFLYIFRTKLSRYQPTYQPQNFGLHHVTRTILLWNSFFADVHWDFTEGDKSPEHLRDFLQCPVHNCIVTSNRSYLDSADMYDAVLFHTARPFPTPNPIPEIRSPHQLYVFALMESPISMTHTLSNENDFYNLTMTYRLDSDISWHYGSIMDIETGVIVAPSVNPKWRQPPETWNDSAVWEVWPQKANKAAWFVSHCHTASRREKLVAQLQKYIDVDIFGKCGPKRCKRDSSACDEMLDAEYKFYLSFENSLCTDYVTEKLYTYMSRLVIPIVFGGADYKRFAPPNSYINAEDFPNVKALANYLKYLAERPELFMRYFWWKKYYRVTFKSPFCDICEKLHSITYQLKTQRYQNIERWWVGDSCRLQSKIRF